MAAFDKNRPEEFEGWDWRILQNGAISLFYRAQVLEEAIEWFQKHQYLVYTFDCAEWESETDILTRVGQTLGFPHYDNPNRDGFNDSLGDVEVPDTGGIVLAFVRFDAFAKRFPGYVQSVLDIFETNSRHFLLTGQRFIVLLQSDDPQIMFKPVGASAVMWNLKGTCLASV